MSNALHIIGMFMPKFGLMPFLALTFAAGLVSLGILRGPLERPELRPYVDAFARGALDPGRLWALVLRQHFLGRSRA